MPLLKLVNYSLVVHVDFDCKGNARNVRVNFDLIDKFLEKVHEA